MDFDETYGKCKLWDKLFELFLNFRIFLHVLEHFEHRPDPDFRKKWKIPDLVDFWEESWAKCIKFFQKFFAKVLGRNLT